MPKSGLYERDFYAWANEQAALLRAGNLSQADIEHIAAEIDSMGRTEKRELISRLTVLLMHLLKWQFQPAQRGKSWRLTIREQRQDLVDHLADNPSLKAILTEAIVAAYRKAVLEAARETDLDEETFPPACPYSFEQMMDDAFWPAADV
ncbi:MAG: DUF29 domain-containing protein [Magnetospirillum sp.]|nr:DUF29 domain-containing protein [Magnetospirillum sp.]